MNDTWKKLRLRYILGIGLITRLVLMPILAHPDLLLTFGRSWEIAFTGRTLTLLGHPVVHAIQAIWLKIWSFFVGVDFFAPLPTKILPGISNPEMMTAYITDNAAPNLNIFIFKLLYLLVDLLVVYLLWRWFYNTGKDNVLRSKLMLAIYWLNPLLIFAVYVFGRFEVFVGLALLLLIWLVRQQRHWLVLGMIPVLIVTRPSLILLAPFIFLLVNLTMRQKLGALVMAGLAIFILFLLDPSAVLNKLSWLSTGHPSYLIASFVQINDTVGAQVQLYVIAYIILLYITWQITRRNKITWHTHTMVYTLVLAAQFALTFYHPQYLAWIVIPLSLMTLLIKDVRQMIIPLILATIGLPLLLFSWRADMWMGLFIPLSLEWGNKDLSGVIAQYIDFRQIANIGWSIVSAGWLILIFWVGKILLLCNNAGGEKFSK